MTADSSTRDLPSDPVPPGSNDRASQVSVSFNLSPGTRLRITVESLDLDGTPLEEKTLLIQPEDIASLDDSAGSRIILSAAPSLAAGGIPRGTPSRPAAGLSFERARLFLQQRAAAMDQTLLAVCLLVYFGVRVIGLVDWPIYFFTDEAIQTVHAADLVANNFFGAGQEFLPTFFVNGSQYNLGVSVYLQVLPYLLFGKSVLVTRLVSVLAATIAAAWLGLILRDIFKLRFWWTGLLLLSAAPAWFLHSRTAFETVLMVSFFTGFLYYYLMYRCRSPRYLYPALVLGALAFYTYSPGQLVMLVSGVLLLISDARYHWQNRRTGLIGLGLLLALAVPYLRFLSLHPQENINHLRIINSYWVQSIPLAEKLGYFFNEYLVGLTPGYWFIPNERDLDRHLMKGYGHLLRASLPFAFLGLILSLRKLRSSPHRLLLIAMVAAPSGAALARLGITRALMFVVPAILLTALGVSAVMDWLVRRRVPARILSPLVFGGLLAVNFFMLGDALRNGPTWFTDYGLGGMQYGARQLFPAVHEVLEQDPDTRVIVSPSWANGTDVVARFFSDSPVPPYELGSINGWMTQYMDLSQDMLFVMIPEEYQGARDSGKFQDIRVERTLPYPNGQTGFYFVRLRYADSFKTQLAQESEQRRQLQRERVELDGQAVDVLYSSLDMGEIGNIFDGDPTSMMRTWEANPLVIELSFGEPRELNELVARIGGTATRVTASIYVEGRDEALVFEHEVAESSEMRQVALDFGEPFRVTRLHLEVFNVYDIEPAHVHLWEVQLR